MAYSGTAVSISPTAALAFGTSYSVTITTGAQDLAGNPLATDYTWTFTTGTAAHFAPPTVVSTIPASGGTTISINSPVTVFFSETMLPLSMTTQTFTLKQGSTVVDGAVTYADTVATFTPNVSLAYNTIYTGTITTGAQDQSGNPMTANYVWTFTTAPDTTLPTVLSTNPASGATLVAVTSSVVATFSEAMAPASISGTTFTLLEDGSLAVAGTVSYSGTMATFKPTANLNVGHSYSAAITTGAQDLAGNPLAANFAWTFTTVPDTTPPTVLSFSPASGTTFVDVTSSIVSTFSEAMSAATISTSTFSVGPTGFPSVAGTVTASGTTATFKPTANLPAGNITVRIANTVKDLAGNAMVSTFTYQFSAGNP